MNGTQVQEKWYEHEPDAMTENDCCKILWDFSVQTDHVIGTRRPDIIIADKKERISHIVDFAVLYDGRVGVKENEKIENIRIWQKS